VKILIVKPSSLGDIIQTLPVLRLLKAGDRRREIYWWISSELAQVLHGDPDLSGVFLFERQRWAAPWHWAEVVQRVRELRAQRFDWVIDLQGLARSSLIAWAAGGALTVGVEDWREGAPALYDLVIPRPSFQTHAVEWYLEVVRRLGVPVHSDFTWLPPRPQVASEVHRKWKVQAGRWMIVNPGARWPNKRWPMASYAAVVRKVAAKHPDVHFAILGGKTDSEAGASIGKACPERCLDLTAQTSLSEMIEWIRLSELVVSNDTGPMHVAAALGKPVVSIFGPTDPRRTGPHGQAERVLRVPLPCAPCLKPVCHHRPRLECLEAISPERVCDAVEQLLGMNKPVAAGVD
jgi:lipopolysaccharide heptosyltransferase II